MKIDVVGAMCTWTKELSTSFIIDEKIMFDIPQGSFKTLLHNYDLSKIDCLIISHFHSDHFMDFHLLIDLFKNNFENKKLTVIAPKGCKERLITIFNCIYVGFMEGYVNDNVTFITAENGKTVEFEGYKIKCYSMSHYITDAYGYVVSDGKSKVGFTGDTCMCNNVLKILKNCQTVFIDTSSVDINLKHLSVGEVLQLQKDCPSVKFWAVHTNYLSKDLAKDRIDIAEQGQVIYI